jgi:hypothetical protein
MGATMAMTAERSAMLRGAVLVVAVLELLYWLMLAPGVFTETWTGYSAPALAYMIFLLVVCPVLALAGLVLAIRNRRIGLAALLVAIQPIAFIGSVVAFAIGVARYGF